MDSNIYRINDYSILRITDTRSTSKFFELSSGTSKQLIVAENDKAWKRTVFHDNFNSKDTIHRLNKVFLNEGLLQLPNINTAKTFGNKTIEVILRQWYRWDDNQRNTIFGLLITIIEPNSNTVVLSQIVQIEDFSILDSKLLIDGSFWMEAATLQIPNNIKNLSVQVTEVKYGTDIAMDGPTVGLIYNYPIDFIPLISEKPLPDYIQSLLIMDKVTGMLTIQLKTTENKTIEKSILDYFEQEVADIKISHVVTYGTISKFKQLRISNEINKYLPITFAPDLSDFPTGNIDITVTTEILVNNKLAVRESKITVNTSVFLNPTYAEMIKHPDTIYPVEVKVEQNVAQTVIEKEKELESVVIYKPVFTEIISESFKIDKKNITFEKLSEPSYLVIHATDRIPQQMVQTKQTEDNVWYFDLSELIAVDQETTYVLRSVGSDTIIGTGKVLNK